MSYKLLLLCALLSMDIMNCDECNVIVLSNTQLREEIRRQIVTEPVISCNSNTGNANLSKSMPGSSENCSCASLKQQISEEIRNAANDTLMQLKLELAHLTTPGYNPHLPATSCKEILQLTPHSPSGLYWIRGTDNGPKHMYCDMERSCKGVAGGWMRLVSINMTDPVDTCPSGLKTLSSPRRLCAMNIEDGCSSAIFPVQGVKYSQVCGKIIGYQQKSPDAFHPYVARSHNTIDSQYVDGISITYGRSPRKHVWTFAAALHEHNSFNNSVCPCTNTRNNPPPAVPPFIGNDYFCDTGSENRWRFIFYPNDPLWDGAGCGQYSTCCTWNSPPWFRKDISSPTSDDIEMRLCADQPHYDEDITFEKLELYVQ